MMLIPVRPVGGAPHVDAYEEFRETIKKLSAKFEKMISVYDMAHAPLVLGAYGRLQRAIMDHGSFDARTREAIALVVADNCADCRFPHTVGCRAAGWTLEQINALHAGTRIGHEEKITALLAVARRVAGNAGDVDENTWRHALRTGWTIDELAELLAHVFANILTNYLDHYARTEPDPMPVSVPTVTQEAWPQGTRPQGTRPQGTRPQGIRPQGIRTVRCGGMRGTVESWLRISGTSGRTA